MNSNLNRRILVIDDNRAIHDDFRKILSTSTEGTAYDQMSAEFFGESQKDQGALGFTLDAASQGLEGLEMVKQALAAGKPYGMAFIDVRMPPGMDGIETTAKIWEVDPDLQVVICTAYSDYSWDEMTRKLGQTDRFLILKKPFDTVEVLQLAETLSRKWTLARQAALRLSDMEVMVIKRTQDLRVSNEKLTQEIAERSQAQTVLSAFSTLGSLLSKARTTKEAGQIIVDTADRLLGYDACFLDLYSPDTNLLTHVLIADLISGQRQELVPPVIQMHPSPLGQKALKEGGQLVLKSNPEEQQPGSLLFGDTSRPSASIMYVPIRNGNAATGILSLQSYTHNAYSQRSLEILQSLADHCGGALDRIRTEEALHNAQEQLRQSQKLEAIGQLASGVAHDFNNLLAIISASAGLVLMETPESSTRTVESLREITAAVERAANLTRQLLAFSRKQMMRSQHVNLDDVIKNLSKMLKRIIGEHIEMHCDYTPTLPPIQADIGMLEQVLVNLVVNARDAMPGGGQLVISTEQLAFGTEPDKSHPESRAGDFVCMTVKDTGIGISSEILPRIFDPFFTTKEVGKGTGLGLATVYGLVKQHQGWIEVSSQTGQGTAFKIYFPALDCPRVSPEEAAKDQEPPRGKETILLVEDEKAVRVVTRLLLERSGYRVIEADSGPQALDVWESAAAEVDLLLTDVIMPAGVTGRRLAEELFEKKPSLKIIFQSGYGGDIMRDSGAFLRQANGYFLQKPCVPKILLTAVRNCLDGVPPQQDQIPEDA